PYCRRHALDDATIRTLNDINRRFYETVAADFDATRQGAWAGWERVAEIVRAGLGLQSKPPAPTEFSILDVGCGNGRFGVFLAERLERDRLRYVGIDSSAALLDRARLALAGLDVCLEQRDIVEQPPDESLGQFDLVALFGVLHHIPGADPRVALLRALAQRVAPGGLLAFTEWRFMDEARFRERVVAWDSGISVEPGDYLLDWRRGEQALRYCHHVDDAEHVRLVAATGLATVAEYRADAANMYTVLRKAKTEL
ncbi:MAG: class I SAM-dependent methyltransferase, partial [Anaerolineae bacterium]|nr:class I SAM-dependent methyltransferase [Anaerolineae bacterium]